LYPFPVVLRQNTVYQSTGISFLNGSPIVKHKSYNPNDHWVLLARQNLLLLISEDPWDLLKNEEGHYMDELLESWAPVF
jgi:hypothetical protein